MKRMEFSEAQSLLRRIRTDVCGLFLGQDYLRLAPGINPYFEQIYCLVGIGSKPQNWKDAVTNHTDVQRFYAAAERVSRENFQDLPQLTAILQLPWNCLATSNIDRTLNRQMYVNGVTDVNDPEFPDDMLSKRNLHCLYLFGQIDDGNYPPPSDEGELLSYENEASYRWDKLKSALRNQNGILVIDGWSPEDWLDGLDLFDGFRRKWTGDSHIYIFGIPDEILREQHDLAGYENNPNISVFEGSLFENLQEVLSIEEETFEEEVAQGLTISLPDRNLRIPLEEQHGLLRMLPNVRILSDEAEAACAAVTAAGREAELLHFLRSGDTVTEPYWKGFNPANNWYISRSKIDDVLFRRVMDKLRSSDIYHARAELVEGDSCSGKTVVLANLAYRVKCTHKYPVVFIQGKLPDEFAKKDKKTFEELCTLIKYLSDKARTSILVVWDRNSYLENVVFVNLKRKLASYNVVLVGSCYSFPEMSQGQSSNLEKPFKLNEYPITQQDLSELFGRVGIRYREQFDRIAKQLFQEYDRVFGGSSSGVWNLKYTHFLSRMLSQLRDQNSTQLVQQHLKNAPLTEEKAQVENVVQSWKKQIDQGAIPLGTVEQELRDVAQEAIRQCNQALAVAGQFCIGLPIKVVSELLHSLLLRRKNYPIEDLLRRSSLIRLSSSEEGERYVIYRHFDDAIAYIQSSGMTEENQIDSLCAIIKASDLNRSDETVRRANYDIIQLIRFFTPNDNNRSRMDVVKKYQNSSQNLYLKLAAALESKNEKDADLDGQLCAAVLRREQFRPNELFEGNRKEFVKKNLDEAYKNLIRLEKIAQNRIGHEKELMRIYIEMCANRVRVLPDYDNMCGVDILFEQEHLNCYREIVAKFKQACMIRFRTDYSGSFALTSLLDVFLNAFLKYVHGAEKAHQEHRDTNWYQGLSGVEGNNYEAFLAINSAYAYEKIQQLLFESWEDVPYKLLGKVSDTIQCIGREYLMNYIEKQLKKHNNASYLALAALQEWQEEDGNTYLLSPDTGEQYIRSSVEDVYYSKPSTDNGFVPRNFRKYAEASLKLLNQEENVCLIREANSVPCAEIRLRSRWIYYTGHMPFTEKQRIGLTSEQWAALNEDAYEVIRFAQNANERPWAFAVFIHSIYELLNNVPYNDLSSGQSFPRNMEWGAVCRRPSDTPDYIILCVPIEGEYEFPSWKVRCHIITNTNDTFLQRSSSRDTIAEFAGPIDINQSLWNISTDTNFHIIHSKANPFDPNDLVRYGAEIRFKLNQATLAPISSAKQGEAYHE